MLLGSQHADARTDGEGRFILPHLAAGTYHVMATAAGFSAVRESVTLQGGDDRVLNLQLGGVEAHAETITVSAGEEQPGTRSPDPGQRVLVRDELLDANPGGAGVPVSLPGLPVESASGGIKAPQYFAPGVAGDHGEPIATYLQVGGFAVPNNLSANAHGNGYSDPNLMVGELVESVRVDGGAFSVLQGNHSVDLAATYALRADRQPFVDLTGDWHDVDLTAGWKWLAVEAAYGNGFLETPEHRRQFKWNALHGWNLGRHRFTVLLVGYYGQSRIPGLVPVGVAGLHGTIDPRQSDQTHTGLLALNDAWHPSTQSELQLSGYFRTYNLALLSNFGDGLIRQSEFRTSAGGNVNYSRRIGRHAALLAGFDYTRQAPRREDLDHYDSAGWEKVTGNDITIQTAAAFVALDGDIFRWLRYNAGWRREQAGFENTDLLRPVNSFVRGRAVDLPKLNLTIVPSQRLALPEVAFGFGEAFFTNDPRIGTGSEPGSLLSRAHSYQLVVSQRVRDTDLRVVLGRVTQEASLAKIDPDTGLQFNEGPGRNRYISISARRCFAMGLLQASVSKADARDLSNGAPVPEAPRLIVDVLATLDRLPFGLRAKAEFEDVGRKPLDDGFTGVPVRALRGAVVRSFRNGRMEAGAHIQFARGYTGQTTEVLALPGESDAFERVVGVALASYATATFQYRFGRRWWSCANHKSKETPLAAIP